MAYKVADFRIARAAKQLLPPDTRIGLLHEQKADFSMHPKALEGLLRAPGVPENAFGTRGACF